MSKIREYDFPNAVIKRLNDGTYREYPKWTIISVRRSRQYVAEALLELRKFRSAMKGRAK
ncbi:hypothetical protein [Simplicispira suum]|uniref:Uncharacterized protein n=1 Tax=Simplicispira suum TaxID=2109915 RepID=A0A2S0N681_9BURK|nr:hypothetical protein [Simplicispira suum]AVO43481.1 hypothetical protein C6571_18835 [Simplicispira suum]